MPSYFDSLENKLKWPSRFTIRSTTQLDKKGTTTRVATRRNKHGKSVERYALLRKTAPVEDVGVDIAPDVVAVVTEAVTVVDNGIVVVIVVVAVVVATPVVVVVVVVSASQREHSPWIS